MYMTKYMVHFVYTPKESSNAYTFVFAFSWKNDFGI